MRISSITRRRWLVGAMTASVVLPAARASAQQTNGPAGKSSCRLLTAHPAAFSLASVLTKGSGITVQAVQPARLPATRLTSYLGGRGKTALADAARNADAVVTFRSFWPDDPLYPHARRTNIRIVELDAGRPLDGMLPGIAIAEPRDDSAVYKALDLQPMPPTGEGSAPWLSPTSLGRMADILAADFARLDPSSGAIVAANLASFKQHLLALKAKTDVALGNADDLTAIALSPHFAYLAADLGIDLRASITAAPGEWTAERSGKLVAWLRDNAVTAVLLDAPPTETLAEAIKAAGARSAVLASIQGEVGDPTSIIETNLRTLTDLFGRSR